MIYVGLIFFTDVPNNVLELESALKSYALTSLTTVIRKKNLTFCYTKLSDEQDMDDVWENESSLLVGRVFDKEGASSLKKETFRSRTYLRKDAMLQKIWGKYVYIGINEYGAQFDIVVDPTGQLPFFYYAFSSGDILFSSDIEIIFKVLGQKPQYNWTYLCSYIFYGNSSAIQTPFQNIYELPPACSLSITKNARQTKSFWNPLSSRSLGKDAVEVLNATLKAWIEPYKNICVSLSGGLDSSTLVYCLNSIKREDQNLSAMNYFHPLVKSSNELIYARKVCKETGIELIEFDASQSLPFDTPNKKYPLNPNKPVPGLVSSGWLETISERVLSSGGSCTFLSGHGSDHIFMRPPSKKSVSDYIIEKGFKGLKTQLKDISTFYRDPLFSILKENIASLGTYFFSQRLDKRHPKNTNNETPEWIKQVLHQKKSTDFVHPIYETLSMKVLPGKYEQIDALYDGLASIHMGIDRVSPITYPFLYEPIVEFALSLPTYTLFNKGYDRYPIRKAVSDHFKTETVWRQDKSQTTGVLQLGVKKNLEQVLNICLNGQFVKQNLIDREGLHNTIMRISNGDNKYMWFFIYLASTEIFLKYWEEKYW